VALRDVAKLALEIETSGGPRPRVVLDAPVEPVWTLALDEISVGVDFSPRLPFDGPGDFTGPNRFPRVEAKDAPALSTILRPIELDPLTVADDANFLQAIEAQPNVPEAIRRALRELY
jgi:hypothetical protein